MGESATREGDFFDSFLPHVGRTLLIPYGGADLEVQIERDELVENVFVFFLKLSTERGKGK